MTSTANRDGLDIGLQCFLTTVIGYYKDFPFSAPVAFTNAMPVSAQPTLRRQKSSKNPADVVAPAISQRTDEDRSQTLLEATHQSVADRPV